MFGFHNATFVSAQTHLKHITKVTNENF